MLNEMHEKALKTMQVLCDHLNADSRDLYAEHVCQQEMDEESGLLPNSIGDGIYSLLTRNQLSSRKYKKVNNNVVIKLLLRCKQIYEALNEIKKILQLILRQEELFDEQDGDVILCIQKYETVTFSQVSESDQRSMIKTLQLLQ